MKGYGHDATDVAWKVFGSMNVPMVYRKGEMVYWQGERAERFYYLKQGSVRIFISSENGTEKTLTMLGAGTLFGEASFFDELPRVSSARVMEKSEIVAIDRPMLLQYFRRQPQLAMELLRYLAQTVRMLSEQVDNMAFWQADRRIAQVLLSLAGESRIVAATHEEIGNLAGVSRVTVSRTLNQFKQNGWISTHYREISLMQEGKLREFSTKVSPDQ